jgi:hypothetical protein
MTTRLFYYTSLLIAILVLAVTVAVAQTPSTTPSTQTEKSQITANANATGSSEYPLISLQTRSPKRPWFSLITAASAPPTARQILAQKIVLGNGTVGRLTKWTDFNLLNSFIGDSNIFEDSAGKVGVGTTTPSSPLTVRGMIESTLGGFKFPDGSVQATAGISPTQVLKSLNGLRGDVTLAAGANTTITPSGNTLTIASIDTGLTSITTDPLTLTGNGTSSSPLSVRVPLVLDGEVEDPINGIVIAVNFGTGSGIVGDAGSGPGVRGTSSNNGVEGFGKNGVVGTGGGGGSGVVGTGSTGVTGIGTPGVRGIGGVVGQSDGGGSGVVGESKDGYGVEALGNNGAAIFARSHTNHIFVGVGSDSDFNDIEFRVTNDGDVQADGSFTSPAGDFAEMIEVELPSQEVAKAIQPGQEIVETYQPGDVLIISPETGKLKKCQQAYCPLVAGVYSTQPGFLAAQPVEEKDRSKTRVPLALVGVVPCKVSAENGPIQIGDLLVTSSIPGFAMKGTDRSLMLGAIVGKALEPLSSGTGTIRVLLTSH